MARLRKFIAYRRIERAYTRISKYKNKSFVRTRPSIVISKYEMGNPKIDFPYQLDLVSNQSIQIRNNALESARQTANRMIEKNFVKDTYFLKLLVFPHHILRENPLAGGAGADRLSTGMKHAFGKPIGTAARIHEGQTIFRISFSDKNKADIAKRALHRASTKLPKACSVIEVFKKVEELKQ